MFPGVSIELFLRWFLGVLIKFRVIFLRFTNSYYPSPEILKTPISNRCYLFYGNGGCQWFKVG